MEEPPPVLEPRPEGPKPPAMSLAARLLNVFAVPGDVFDDVKAGAGSVGDWLAPALLLAVVGAVSAVIVFSQPAIQQQVREQQEKRMEQMVKAGKLSQADADKALAVTERFMGPAMLKIFGTVGAVFTSFARIFWWGFVLWLLGRWFLKVRLDFSKTLGVAGLAMMISVLGTIVGVLLIVNLGRLFAGPSLALAINDFDETRKSHLFLGAANVFSFWLVGVMSVGLAKLAGAPFLRAAWLVVAYWLAQESFFILVGLGQLAL